MTRVLISDFGIIQKTLANAVVAFYVTDASGENTGVKATLFLGPTGAASQENPQTLDADGKLANDCYVESQIMASISGISGLTQRSIKKVRDNPLEFSLPVTSANWAKQAGEDLYGNLSEVQAAVAAVEAVLTDPNFVIVAGDLQGANNIGAVGSHIANVNIVAANNANVTTVATNLTGTNTIGTVAGSIANVNNVGNNIAHVVAVDANAANINAAVANAANINIVAGDHAAINIVAGDHVAINSVYTNMASVLTAAANILSINIVAAAIASVITAANNIGAIILAAAGVVSYKQKAVDYQLLVTDTVVELTGGSHTFTFPDFLACGSGKAFVIKNTGAGVLTWATTSAQTVDGSISGTLAQYQALSIYGNGANAIITA